MNRNTSITIIGGGIVGCGISYELAKRGYKNITVVERNETIPGLNQSSTNEGTIHSGIYYPKSIMPLKASLCVEGNDLMYEFLEEYEVPYKKVGKLIVATNSQEEEYLEYFLSVAQENGVPDVEKISGSDAMQLEPNLSNITQALRVPSTGVTSPNAVIRQIMELSEDKGVVFLTGSKVTTIVAHQDSVDLTLESKAGIELRTTEVVINSAGLYSDEVARMINPNFLYTIEQVRGEFYQFNKAARPEIWMNGMHVYQPPYCYTTENGVMEIVNVKVDQLPELLKEGKVVITAGVHLSPTYDEQDEQYAMGNTVTISPLKTTGIGKEDYTNNLHPASDYIKNVHLIFPHLTEEDIKPDHTGIMAPLSGYRDFIIQKDSGFSNCINLVGMESPAWTSTFAIARYVAALLDE